MLLQYFCYIQEVNSGQVWRAARNVRTESYGQYELTLSHVMVELLAKPPRLQLKLNMNIFVLIVRHKLV